MNEELFEGILLWGRGWGGGAGREMAAAADKVPRSGDKWLEKGVPQVVFLVTMTSHGVLTWGLHMVT